MKQKTTFLYARGLNFMGQLGINNKNLNVKYFEKSIIFQNHQITQIEGHLAQSVALLSDGQIVSWGYIFDSLTTNRILSFYKNFPKLAQWWQKYSCFGATLGLRQGSFEPTLLNRNLIFNYKIKKIALGGSYVLCLTENGNVFGLGDNYKGQLGNITFNYNHNFERFTLDPKEVIIDIAAGFQHSLLLSKEGYCYATGKTNYSQILRDSYDIYDTNSKEFDHYKICKKIVIPNESIVKVAAGFHHTMYLTARNHIYCHGLNTNGQCAASNLSGEHIVNFLNRVFINLEPSEEIIQIAAGKSHSIILTNKNKVFCFGAAFHGQMGRKSDYDLDICSPQLVNLNLEPNDNIIKIKADFDRSCIITEKGDCFIWGGEPLAEIGGETVQGIVNLKEELGISDCKIVDVGLGYMHTLVVIERNEEKLKNNE